MGPNTRLHDAIIAILIITGSLLGYFVHQYFLFLPILVGAIMLQSFFTGFCPVYYTLGKVRKNT